MVRGAAFGWLPVPVVQEQNHFMQYRLHTLYRATGVYMASIKETILAIVAETLKNKGIEIDGLDESTPVGAELGLDSLDWATVVVRIEDETGLDPFAKGNVGQLVTIADLIFLYEGQVV